MPNLRIAEYNKATRFPVNRQNHTKKGPYFKCALMRLMKKKWPMQCPTGELVNMQGTEGIASALWWEALRGDINAIREVIDRVDGKVPQKLEGEGFNDVTQIIIHPPEKKKEKKPAPVSRNIPV